MVLPVQHPGFGGVRLLHGRHREGVPGALQGAEDRRLRVDPLPRGEATKAQVMLPALLVVGVCPVVDTTNVFVNKEVRNVLKRPT